MSFCAKLVRRFVPDPDETFAYSTPRFLTIKDWRLGVGTIVLQFVIFCYIIVFQVVFQQVHMREADLTASLRVGARQGAPAFNWVAPPFCLGVTQPAHPSATYASQYSINTAVTPPTYTYTGPGASGVPFVQRQCTWLDEADAVPLEENDAAFLLTETRLTPQTWSVIGSSPLQACGSPLLSTQGCAYLPDNSNSAVTTTRSYVPDIEFFTVSVDHNVVAPQARITRTVRQMEGNLVDLEGKVIDPCIGYTSLGLQCPTDVVGIGKINRLDIIPLRSLMLAAGVQSLDVLSGTDSSGPQTSSTRMQGMVLILDISYSNFFLGNIETPSGANIGGTGTLDNSAVRYLYRVTTIPATQFQFTTTSMNAPQPGENPNTALPRLLRRVAGVRLIITTGGRIGSFFFQTLLINITAGLALLGLSSTILEFIAFSLCPLRGMYRQLKDRETVSITELRAAGRKDPEAYKALIKCVQRGRGRVRALCPPFFFPPLALIPAPLSPRTHCRTYNSGEAVAEEHPPEVLKVLNATKVDEPARAVELTPRGVVHVDNALRGQQPAAVQVWGEGAAQKA